MCCLLLFKAFVNYVSLLVYVCLWLMFVVFSTAPGVRSRRRGRPGRAKFCGSGRKFPARPSLELP